MKSTQLIFDPALSAEELRGFSRTVAEIEWLLLILVMLYQVVLAPDEEASAALSMAMFFFAAFVLSFHYANFYRKETHWKIAHRDLGDDRLHHLGAGVHRRAPTARCTISTSW